MTRAAAFGIACSIATVAMSGCNEPVYSCGIFRWDPDRMICVCPEGSVELPDGSCMLDDGGIIRPPNDGGIDDGGRDDGGPVDAWADAGVDSSVPDACTEQQFYRDSDGDGAGDPSTMISACDAPSGYVDNAGDCDDSCGTCSPDGSEVCDGLNNDCDGTVDEGVMSTFYRDADMDGFGDATIPMQSCAVPAGFVDNDGDCDDTCMDCRPGGAEVCEGSLDEDCSMGVDNGCACTIGMMRPCPGGSDVGECVAGTQTCTAGAWGSCVGGVPPSVELCNSRDDDCDTVVDGPAAASACGSAARATTVGCTAGTCVVTACTAGYSDCDSMFSNGCEATLGTLTACTGCGDVCGWDCESGGCNDAALVVTGGAFTCALRASGGPLCWGQNRFGQLGNGTTTNSATPAYVASLPSGAVSIAAGGYHACAVLSTGAVSCWGENSDGQLGDNTTTDRLSPVSVAFLTGVTAVSASTETDAHTCALRSSGNIACWGNNASGQLGDGTREPALYPTPVIGLSGPASAIVTGGYHTCALLTTGAVQCWGTNSAGQLGNGGTTGQTAPTTVSSLSGVTAITAGVDHTCALLSTGAVRCWGRNTDGRLGDGTMTNRLTPTPVLGLTSGVTAISAGARHTCALLSSGDVRCWGSNSSGQLGDGTTTNRSTPVAVGSLAEGVARLAPGRGAHTCVVLASGAVRCWGGNLQGQLGDGTTTNRTVPVAVVAP